MSFRSTKTSRIYLAPVALSLAGCANPGPPKPPSLHLPRAAAQLQASRAGDRVDLTWKTSADTSDGVPVRGAIQAILCRDPGAPVHLRAEEIPCTDVQHLTVVPGQTHATDVLPPALTSGQPALLIYRVKLLNDRGRSAGASDPVYAVSGSAPSPAGAIELATRRNGVLITWAKAAPEQARMELQRTLRSSSSSSPAKPATAELLTLRSDDATQADSGGMVDTMLHDGDTLVYTAQRVRRVTLEIPAATVYDKKGQLKQTAPTKEALELRGLASAPVTFTFHDTLPPSIPTGLAAVPGGGFGQAPSVDLSWSPNPEADVLAYNIYRADAKDPSSFTRLNAEPVAAPAYRDLSARPGRTYLYQVTAVDVRRNESAACATVTERINP